MEINEQHTSPSTQNLLVINSTSCYTLAYDASKVRVYYGIQGYWKNETSVADLLADWEKALNLVIPGFTLLIDMRTMITHPQKLVGLHEQVQQKLAKAGVSRIANIMPTDKIASLQAAALTRHSKLPFRNFDVLVEGERWLDEKEAQA